MSREKINYSIFLNVGLLFGIVYFAYFLFIPSWYFIDNFLDADLLSQSLIETLYDKHNLIFLSYKSLYLSSIGLLFFLTGYCLVNNVQFLRIANKSWSFRNILVALIVIFSGGILSKIRGILNGAHLHFHFDSDLIQSNLVVFFTSINILQVTALVLAAVGLVKAIKEKKHRWKKIFAIIFVSLFILLLSASFLFGSKFLTISIAFSVSVVFSTLLTMRLQIITLIIIGLFGVSTIFVKNYIEDTETIYATKKEQVLNSIDSFVGRVNQTHIVTEITLRDDDKVGLYPYLEIVKDFLPATEREKFRGEGNRFGHEYGFISASDFNTGVGKTIIGDFYLSFGFFGVTLGMLIVGFIFRLISLYASISYNGLLFYSMVMPTLLVRIEQGFVYLINSIVFVLIITTIVSVFASKGGIFDRTIDKFFSMKR
jgi:hypothetical protein